jgi:hypothetical protein
MDFMQISIQAVAIFSPIFGNGPVPPIIIQIYKISVVNKYMLNKTDNEHIDIKNK